jgi:HEAT repeat protein
MSTAAELLNSLDSETGSKRAHAQDRLISLGESAIDDIVRSIAEINARLFKRENPEFNMPALERRVFILGRIRSMNGILPILNALADSAGAVESLSQQIDQLHNSPDMPSRNMLTMATARRDIALSLRTASEDALASFGSAALPYVHKYLLRSPDGVRQSLQRVASKVEKSWWQFWK